MKKIIITLAIIFGSYQTLSAQDNSNNLPYASTLTSNQSDSASTEWKMVGPDLKPVVVEGYVKVPYHNPNLIKDLTSATTQEQDEQNKIQKLSDQLEEEKMKNICSDFYMARRAKHSINAATVGVYDRSVTSRQIMPMAKFRDYCSEYYMNHRTVNDTYNTNDSD